MSAACSSRLRGRAAGAVRVPLLRVGRAEPGAQQRAGAVEAVLHGRLAQRKRARDAGDGLVEPVVEQERLLRQRRHLVHAVPYLVEHERRVAGRLRGGRGQQLFAQRGLPAVCIKAVIARQLPVQQRDEVGARAFDVRVAAPADALIEARIGALQQVLHVLGAPRLHQRVAQHVLIGLVVYAVEIGDVFRSLGRVHVPLPLLCRSISSGRPIRARRAANGRARRQKNFPAGAGRRQRSRNPGPCRPPAYRGEPDMPEIDDARNPSVRPRAGEFHRA